MWHCPQKMNSYRILSHRHSRGVCVLWIPLVCYATCADEDDSYTVHLLLQLGRCQQSISPAAERSYWLVSHSLERLALHIEGGEQVMKIYKNKVCLTLPTTILWILLIHHTVQQTSTMHTNACSFCINRTLKCQYVGLNMNT